MKVKKSLSSSKNIMNDIKLFFDLYKYDLTKRTKECFNN